MTMTEHRPGRKNRPATSTALSLDVPWCISEDQQAWRDTVANFADEILAPVAAENYVTRPLPCRTYGRTG